MHCLLPDFSLKKLRHLPAPSHACNLGKLCGVTTNDRGVERANRSRETTSNSAKLVFSAPRVAFCVAQHHCHCAVAAAAICALNLGDKVIMG